MSAVDPQEVRLYLFAHDRSRFESPSPAGSGRRMDCQISSASGLSCSWKGPWGSCPSFSTRSQGAFGESSRDGTSYTTSIPRQVRSCSLGGQIPVMELQAIGASSQGDWLPPSPQYT